MDEELTRGRCQTFDHIIPGNVCMPKHVHVWLEHLEPPAEISGSGYFRLSDILPCALPTAFLLGMQISEISSQVSVEAAEQSVKR